MRIYPIWIQGGYDGNDDEYQVYPFILKTYRGAVDCRVVGEVDSGEIFERAFER